MEIEETIEWIPDSESIQNSPDYETLKTWLLVDKKKLIIDDETHFVDSTILHWILKCKVNNTMHKIFNFKEKG